MSIRVTCPSGHALKLADSMAGRVGPCPICRKPVQVPAEKPGRAFARSEISAPDQGSPDAVAKLPLLVSTLGQRAVAASVAETLTRKVAPTDAVPSSAVALGEAITPAVAQPATSPIEPGPSRAKALADTAPMANSVAEEEADLEWAADLTWAEPVSPPSAVDPGNSPLFVPPANVGATPTEGESPGAKTTILGAWKILGATEPPQLPASPIAGAAFFASLPPAALLGSAQSTAKSTSQTFPPKKAVATRPRKPSASNSAILRAADKLSRSVRGFKAPWSQKLSRTISRSGDVSAPVNSKTSQTEARKRSDSENKFRRTVYLTAIGLAVISLVAMLPALKHWDLGAAPGWARGVLLWSLLQLAYAAWLASMPDWGALWVAMFVFAGTATLYGSVGTVALATSSDFDLPLDLAPVRAAAPLWCAAMALVMLAAAYWCGRAAQRAKRFNQT